jgi:hypothetical protein
MLDILELIVGLFECIGSIGELLSSIGGERRRPQ